MEKNVHLHFLSTFSLCSNFGWFCFSKEIKENGLFILEKKGPQGYIDVTYLLICSQVDTLACVTFTAAFFICHTKSTQSLRRSKKNIYIVNKHHAGLLSQWEKITNETPIQKQRHQMPPSEQRQNACINGENNRCFNFLAHIQICFFLVMDKNYTTQPHKTPTTIRL